MNSMRQRWLHLNDRYMALSRRERIMVAAAVVFGPFMLVKALLLDPAWTRIHNLKQGEAAQVAMQAELQRQFDMLQQQVGSDPDAAKKAELAALTAESKELDQELKSSTSALVHPEEMNGLLEHLLARQRGLRLLSMKTLAPVSMQKTEAKEGVGEPAGEKAKAPEFGLYRHGVEIRLEGSYADLQAYLEQLEKMPERLLWDRLSYRVIDYPRAEMKLTVYTLSADRTWLAL